MINYCLFHEKQESHFSDEPAACFPAYGTTIIKKYLSPFHALFLIHTQMIDKPYSQYVINKITNKEVLR